MIKALVIKINNSKFKKVMIIKKKKLFYLEIQRLPHSVQLKKVVISFLSF